jgi:hypothetical protein
MLWSCLGHSWAPDSGLLAFAQSSWSFQVLSTFAARYDWLLHSTLKSGAAETSKMLTAAETLLP